MILTLDVGNGHMFGGVFQDGSLTIRFRKESRASQSSDEFGLFLRGVLRENGGDPAEITQIAICSVIPDALYPLRSCCRKYFGIDPFVLQAGAKTGLRIQYRNPLEVGPDRIANAIGAALLYPGGHSIIIDLGTATTIDVVRAGRDYLGGIILPGLRMSMMALEQNTARLPSVEIAAPADLIGRSTIEGIQSGLYFGHRAMIRELTREIRERTFRSEPVVAIGTGGFSRLFQGDQLFDALMPDLVLVGLERALTLNEGASRRWTPPASGVGAEPGRH
jgi:type III pantothenate kinase